MKLWSDFLRDVKPKAPGLPEPVVEWAIFRAAQDFCQYTRAWQVTLDPTTTVDGVLTYDMELGANELVRIESATLAGNDYDVWRQGDKARGTFVYTTDKSAICFNTPEAAGQALVLTCALKPGNKATGIADVIYDAYVRTIAKLAIADLKSDGNLRLVAESDMDVIKVALWRGSAATRPRSRAHFF